MQSFVVSARKYRPVSWDDVVGQDQVVTTLKNAIKNNHLAQSFLFCGPRGVGKTTCARILAKTINCENLQPNGEACNECESCNAFRENASFNIHEIDAASNNSVEDIRSLTDQVRYAPQSGKYKIYIIDEVHMLSQQAFNAFLKTLEEPPHYVKFILATTEKHKIIPTILSRCQIFDFNRIKIKDIVLQLKKICKNEGVECEDEALHLISQKADGAMRDALSIYDRITSFSGKKITAKDVIENLNILDYEYYFKITDAFLTEDVAACFMLFDDVVNKGFDGDTFINGLAEHFRNLLVCKDENTLGLIDTSDTVLERYKNQSEIVPASFLLSALNILNSADVNYRASKNKRLHVELALMKLVYMYRAVSSSQFVEKKTPDLKAEPEKKSPPAIQQIKNEPVEKPQTEFVQKKSEPKQIITEGETVVIPKKSELRSSVKKELNTDEEVSMQVPVVEDTQPISPELFFIVWKKYADLIRQDHQRIAITMDHAEVSILENNLIEIKLDSSIELNLIKDMLSEIRSFIAEAVENNQFELSFKVDTAKNERTKRPYTTQEKYKKMEEKNPLIRELKNTLGLELDY